MIPCPDDCCDDPCVVLGSITLEKNIIPDEGITARRINNWDLRKLVITPGLIEHWRSKWSPNKITFESIVDYDKLSMACESSGNPEGYFQEMCTNEKGNESSKINISDAVTPKEMAKGRKIEKEQSPVGKKRTQK